MNVKKSVKNIPKFGLYGEVFSSQDPGFVHLEDIIDRSKDRDWLIKPHRHGKMFQVLVVMDSRLDIKIDEKSESLTGSWVITVPPGVVHGFHFEPNTQGMVLTLAEPLLTDTNHNQNRGYLDEFMAAPFKISFDKKSPMFAQLSNYLSLLRHELKSNDIEHKLMQECLVKSVLVILKRQIKRQKFEAAIDNRNNHLLNIFKVLLEQNYDKHWSVKKYATHMHTSVSSINRLCNEKIGKTAKAIIQDRLILEAKRLLIYTRMPLDQIAYNLGFKDPAYFSRFFKNLVGLAPSNYRKDNNYETRDIT